jgi:cytoskeletal protein CcmA (bactofilin family)
MINNMFNINKELATPSVNLLSNGTELNGDIVLNGDFRIDGNITGNIKCSGKITVGTTAYIEGKIECQNAEIAGHVCGDIITTEYTIFKESAIFRGNFSTGRLSVESGARLTMSCDMEKKDESF